LQHAKESCIVGVKGNVQNNPRFQTNVASDVIFSERRGQSQKPTEIYEYIEKLVPNGFYLEVFGRRNNLRNNWVTIGNEL
jgi:mRNA (2'-O-methyladenosine-N6-)-methyltransferase